MILCECKEGLLCEHQTPSEVNRYQITKKQRQLRNMLII